MGLDVGDKRRQPLQRHALALGHRDMSIDFIRRVEARPHHQDHDLAHRIGQAGIGGHRQGEIPDRLADPWLMQPGIPRPHEGAVLAHHLEIVEVAGDAFAHAVVERLLFGGQVGGGDQRQTHGCLLVSRHNVRAQQCAADHVRRMAAWPMAGAAQSASRAAAANTPRMIHTCLGRAAPLSPPADGWSSGRWHRTRNAAYLQGYRGFESHPVRQTQKQSRR